MPKRLTDSPSQPHVHTHCCQFCLDALGLLCFRVTSLDKDPLCPCDQSRGAGREQHRSLSMVPVASPLSARQGALVSSRPKPQAPQACSQHGRRQWGPGPGAACCVPGVTRAHWTQGLLFQGRACESLSSPSSSFAYSCVCIKRKKYCLVNIHWPFFFVSMC